MNRFFKSDKEMRCITLIELLPDEEINYLLGEDRKIIQSPNVFSFSLDAVLLANFTYVPIKKGRIVDLCSGNGVIPLFLSTRSKANIIGVEIQSRLADMAQRSVQYNNLENQIEIKNVDLKGVAKELGSDSFDLVTCNPPYFQAHEKTDKNKNEHYTIARHEVMCTLEDVVKESSSLLKMGGKLSMVHRPERLMDILMYMRMYRIEPKRIQFVYPKANKESNMILVEGIKDGKQSGLKVLQPFIVYNDDDTYTDRMAEIVNG